MVDTIIEGLKAFIATCPNLASGVLNVNSLGSEPIQYSIVPQPGSRVLATDILDNETCEYPFAIQSVESTADDLERIESLGIYEQFILWLKSNNASDVFPELPAKHSPISVSAVGWSFLYEQGVSSTGIYQISCKLTYELSAQ